MARKASQRCDICVKLHDAAEATRARNRFHGHDFILGRDSSRRALPSYVELPRLGNSSPPPMKRLYTRADSRTYGAIGWICDQGHVTLDSRNGAKDTHLLTPTFPRKVLCLGTGETVATEG